MELNGTDEALLLRAEISGLVSGRFASEREQLHRLEQAGYLYQVSPPGTPPSLVSFRLTEKGAAFIASGIAR